MLFRSSLPCIVAVQDPPFGLIGSTPRPPDRPILYGTRGFPEVPGFRWVAHPSLRADDRPWVAFLIPSSFSPTVSFDTHPCHLAVSLSDSPLDMSFHCIYLPPSLPIETLHTLLSELPCSRRFILGADLNCHPPQWAAPNRRPSGNRARIPFSAVVED